MVSLAALVIPLLALWLWWPLSSWSRAARAAAILVTAALGVFPALLLHWAQNGTVAYGTLAYLQVPGGWILAVLLLLTVFVLLRDALWCVARYTSRAQWARLLHLPATTVLAIAITGGISAWGIHNGLQAPQVREHAIVLPQLPPALDGLRVAVLADIHASPVNNARYVQTIVERTNAARPDLIVLPGDLVDGDAPTQAANIAPLAQLQAPHGVWSAPGNHEYYSGYDAWAHVYQQLQLHYLANEARVLNIRGHKLAISGIGDPVYGRLSPNNRNPAVAEGVPPDIQAVAQQARAAGAQVHILLAHQPKPARSYAEHGVDLQISGHTHGGHVRGMDRWLVAPANNGFVRGLYTVGPMQLFVSSGAGLWAGFAVRLGVPSAIDLLVLRAPAAAL